MCRRRPRPRSSHRKKNHLGDQDISVISFQYHSKLKHLIQFKLMGIKILQILNTFKSILCFFRGLFSVKILWLIEHRFCKAKKCWRVVSKKHPLSSHSRNMITGVHLSLTSITTSLWYTKGENQKYTQILELKLFYSQLDMLQRW